MDGWMDDERKERGERGEETALSVSSVVISRDRSGSQHFKRHAAGLLSTQALIDWRRLSAMHEDRS
jgi:hypothetical protein